jgi:hypothetical protein
LQAEALEVGLSGVFPNITIIALRICVRLPASVASGEGSSSVLKQVQNCCLSAMGQHFLIGFATLSDSCDLPRKLDFPQ